MPFPLLSPSALADLARITIGQVVETAAAAATLPLRVLAALGQAELLVTRITVLADQAEALIARVSTVVDGAEATVVEARAITAGASKITDDASVVVSDASGVSRSAELVVRQVQATAATATELLDAYASTLRKGAPLAGRFVDELSPDEVTAAIRMVDQLPRLQNHLVNDVMPLLAKLDQVGPDIHKLLTVTEDLHLAILGIPGLKMLRRRGEERAEQGD